MVVRLVTHTFNGEEVAPFTPCEAGVIVAVIAVAPLTVGFQVQVETLLGEVPEVLRSLQFAMRFPFAKNRITPATVDVAEMVTLTPL